MIDLLGIVAEWFLELISGVYQFASRLGYRTPKK